MLRAGVEGVLEGARDAGVAGAGAARGHGVDERSRRVRVRRAARVRDRVGLRRRGVLGARDRAREARASGFRNGRSRRPARRRRRARSGARRHAGASRGRGRRRARGRSRGERGRRSRARPRVRCTTSVADALGELTRLARVAARCKPTPSCGAARDRYAGSSPSRVVAIRWCRSECRSDRAIGCDTAPLVVSLLLG